MLLIFLSTEIMLLYFLSRWVTKTLFGFFLLVFRARSVAISLLLVLQFPGTAVHELSHLFAAGILGVRAGKLSLEPESIRGKEIQTGSVMIAESDPLRRYAIGLAPVIGGIIVLTAIAFLLQNLASQGLALRSYFGDWRFWGLGYLIFAVSNTMFSSPTDLKGILPFALTFGILTGVLYYLGLRIVLTGAVMETVTRVLATLVSSLGVVAGVNTVLLLVTLVLTRLIGRIFRVKIMQ
jgi:hypothetical protein